MSNPIKDLTDKDFDRLHVQYEGMMQRCHNEKSSQFINYGARGIEVCKAWRGYPSVFIDYCLALPSYSNMKQIDRIDNNGSYEPGNIRFVTAKENERNKRTNHLVVYKGKEIDPWIERIGERFSLNDIEKSNLDKFLKTLPAEPRTAIGGGISFIWTPTSIGAMTRVENWNGQTADITDYDSW